jgi:hypothetical protein
METNSKIPPARKAKKEKKPFITIDLFLLCLPEYRSASKLFVDKDESPAGYISG